MSGTTVKLNSQILILVATGASLLAPPALAAPILSGSYVDTESVVCQIDAKVDSGTGQLTIPRTGDTGSASFGAGTITFDSNAGTFTVSGWGNAMSTIFEKFTDGSHRGHRPYQYTNTGNGTYSTTDTTVTINGVTLNAAFGQLDQNGVANGFSALYNETGPYNCVESLVVHQ